ncbi:MAG: hypothetical protein ACMUJM_04905 [bacterium]
MYFTNKDLTLIGIVSAVGLGLGFLIGMPTRALTGMPFIGSLLAGPPRVLLTLIALCRIKKVGVVTFIELIYALTSFLKPGGFPFAFFSPLIGGVVTDLAFWCIKGNNFQLNLGQGALLGGILNLSKPISTLIFFMVLGLPAKKMILRHPLLVSGLLSGSLMLGSLAGLLGAKIGKELRSIGLLT